MPLQFQTAIAINDRPEALPALATAHVLSLFGLTPTVLTAEDLKTKQTFSDNSLLILVENQIRHILKNLRAQHFTGAVIILSATSDQDISQKYNYILQYGKSTNNSTWEKPWSLSQLLNQIIRLEPLRKNNLNLLLEDIEKAEHLLNQSIQSLMLAIEQIPRLTDNSSEQEQQINQIEQQFETLFSPLAKHTQMYLKNYGNNTLAGHFRTLINYCKTTNDHQESEINLLKQIIQTLQEKSQQLGENLEYLNHE